MLWQLRTLLGAFLALFFFLLASCGSSLPLSVQNLTVPESGSDSRVILYFDGDPLSFDIRDFGVALALLLNQQATVPEIQAIASNLLGLSLTVTDITGANPDPLALYDLNGDGQMGQLMDFGVALGLLLGARTPIEIEQICQDILTISCEIQPGATIPTLGSPPMNPATPIAQATPTGDPGEGTPDPVQVTPTPTGDPGEGTPDPVLTTPTPNGDPGEGTPDPVQVTPTPTGDLDEGTPNPTPSGDELDELFPDLPPDPGEEGMRTLEGIDADGDGVRDDVQRFIFQTYSDDERRRDAMLRYARAKQNSIVNVETDSRDQVRQRVLETFRSLSCAEVVYGIDILRGGNKALLDEVDEDRRAIEFEILNTQERVIASLIVSQKFSGQVINMGEVSCN